MYAVVITGGKQYRVEAGTELTIERLAADAGSSVTFDRVLFVGDGDTITVGTPTVDGATVSATVLGESLGPKLRIFKFKQKVKYRRTTGHRQHFTRVRIDEITASGKTVKAEPAQKVEKVEKPARAKAATADAPEEKAGGKAEAKAAATEAEAPKPKRTRKPAAAKAETTKAAAKADATEAEAPKPKRTRKPAAPKAKPETAAEPKTEE
jgi:large subunit ribosomal protein L21